MRRSQKTDSASQKDFLLHRGMWPPTAGARRKLGTSVANGEGEDPRAGERVWESAFWSSTLTAQMGRLRLTEGGILA